ncbi:MAG: DUF2007 domain-containing protein [Myxococcota bacterium]|jgi:hypothetical protein|nr:DUF2007 domain-containing protein [Myxococcota bacterium]
MNYEGSVVLESFSDKAFAEAAVSLLASEGIEAFIHADDAGGELPNLDFARGVRVLVSAEDKTRAHELLNAGDGES